MKNAIKTALFALGICSSISVFAQSASNEIPNENTYITNTKVGPKKGPSNYTGSPYLKEDFQKASVYKNGKAIANGVLVRYNANKDVFETKASLSVPNSEARYIARSKAIYIKILNDVFVYFPPVDTEVPSGYFKVLVENESGVSLYKKYKKQYIEGMKAVNSVASDIAPTYKEKSIFYTVNAKGEFNEMPKSKGGKISSLGSHKKELKAYVKKEKLNISKEKDLSKLISYFNSLQ